MAEIDDDLSANTARFQAFAHRQDEDLQAPWETRASRSKTGLIVGIVIAVVVIVVIVAALAIG
jgi:t-SNARE complex subunit (syntaxin)